MTQLRTLPMCGMCGGNSTRIVQTLRGTFLLCAKCEPPAQAGPITETEAMAPRYKLPPLPARKLPPLPPRKRVIVSPQPRLTPPSTISRRPSKETVTCVVDYTYAENEGGNEQECVVVECSECEHSERSWGHGDKSVRRCLVLMGQNCPEGADNFYILERDE